MIVNVLLYEAGKESEGIHSLELNGNTVILMFEDVEDAERYCGLLEAQDFPTPTVEQLNREDIEFFCTQSGYECKFVEKGFVPKTEDEFLLLSPPQTNLDVSNWKEDSTESQELINKNKSDELDNIKRRLESLL